MNVKQVVGIIVIVVIISIGWFILAGAMKWRTNEYGEMLKGRVVENWGSMQVQNQPFLRYQEKSLNDENKVVTTTYTIDPAASDLDVDLSSSHRRKGLIWYAFYEVDFEGTYTMVNTSGKGQVFTFVCPLPATEARFYKAISHFFTSVKKQLRMSSFEMLFLTVIMNLNFLTNRDWPQRCI